MIAMQILGYIMLFVPGAICVFFIGLEGGLKEAFKVFVFIALLLIMSIIGWELANGTFTLIRTP